MKKPSYILIAWLSMMISYSCSVKEDRSVCPCWMSVNLSGIPEPNCSNAILTMRGNSSENAVDYEFHRAENICLTENIFTDEYEVPRGSVEVSAIATDNRCGLLRKDDVLEIPLGNQMDSLYCYFRTFDTRRESVLCNINLHKEFCTIYLTLGSIDYECPHIVEIQGNVAGISILNLLPVEGLFSYNPACIGGQYIFRVPRQSEDSLAVNLKSNGETADTFPLGEYIAKCGYDWSAEDLADISITIDIPKQQVLVSVSGWEDIIIMDIVI